MPHTRQTHVRVELGSSVGAESVSAELGDDDELAVAVGVGAGVVSANSSVILGEDFKKPVQYSVCLTSDKDKAVEFGRVLAVAVVMNSRRCVVKYSLPSLCSGDLSLL